MLHPTDPTGQIAETVLCELDHFQANFRPTGGALTYASQVQLKAEPFVAYAKAEDSSGRPTQLLISRHYVPFSLRPATQNAEYASYLSPVGRIVSKKVGASYAFQVKHSGIVLEDHKFTLLEKDEFRVHREGDRWDAIDNTIAWLKGAVLVRSLRRVLGGEAKTTESRSLRYSVSLPDKAILDEIQDDIFRLPLARRIRISGAPGTGKTTVLLKRLSQKTKKEFLTEEEQKGIRDQDWKDGHNWMLFTPSDLLKVYLKEAMARELLPASDEHVKVYRTFRLEALRDIGFIKVGERGYFRAASPQLQLMKRSTGAEQLALANVFGTFLEQRYSKAFSEALQAFGAKTRIPLNLLADASQKVLVAALDILSKVTVDPVELRHVQERAANFRRLNEGLNKLIQNVRTVTGLESIAAQSTVADIYRQARSFVSLAGSLNIENLDAALFPEVRPSVENLRQHLRELAESLSLARLAQLIPRAYQEFREDAGHLKRFYLEESEKPVKDRFLTEPEQDVLLFHTLEFARRLYDDLPVSSQAMPNEIRQILLRMRLLVSVDEAADFSPLELACMERFAVPRAGGVTICGDLMQRVTEHGLKDWSEMSNLSPSPRPENQLPPNRATVRHRERPFRSCHGNSSGL